MKQLLFAILLLFPSIAKSQDKLWFSNKIEAGYGKIFISEAVTFKDGLFTKNAFGLGLKFKISDKVKYKTFYLLENKRKNNWAKGHFLGTAIEFKFK
tara:strand:+ start:181 stop:471 length:291 start_codon:yes stop_codon:yes gene_type:complete